MIEFLSTDISVINSVTSAPPIKNIITTIADKCIITIATMEDMIAAVRDKRIIELRSINFLNIIDHLRRSSRRNLCRIRIVNSKRGQGVSVVGLKINGNAAVIITIVNNIMSIATVINVLAMSRDDLVISIPPP
ncbi:hypothetical protein AVM02_00080 [Brucella anthropi]